MNTENHAESPSQAARPASRDSVDAAVSLPVELANDVLEELYELRGERSWWKDEPRCNYQRDYNRLCAEIAALEALLGRQANEKLSDSRREQP